MSHFFIDRPIFAWVIAIMIMVAGAMALFRLPVEQYPQVAPPSITITATYPGASAKTVEDTVTQIIEQKMNGLDYLRYIESSSDSSGTASVVITFNGGANADIAQVQVQNKLQSAIPLLPQEVQALGVQVSKSSSSMLLVVGLVSDDGRMSSEDLSDFVFGTLQDPVSRVAGVGSIQAFGSQYAMRIWLHPDKLMQYKLTSADVSAAITAQNSQVSSGNLGALPAVPGQRLDATITTRGRLETPAQFGDILLRTNPDGSRVYLRDVARIELGSENYNIVSRFNGGPAAGFVINPAAGANALETVAAVKAKLAEMQPFFPKGLRLVYPFDTTPFVKHSITDVIKTLIEAVVLVFLVMYLFLGNLRATIIPTITVPVVLLGTFGVLAVLGYSVNTLTLFGLVLAIGLLVDDAIVVVENVERLMEEEGLSPREAARKSMTQITGALVGIGLVLCAAFLPMAFMGNSIGVIYRQFAVTMSTAIALSVVVALILTPALCATMLKPVKKGELHEQKGFFGWFNRMFSRTTNRYVGVVDFVLRRRALLFVGYAGICIAVIMMFRQLPTGFLPEEDTGTVMAMAMLPAGATIEQSEAVLKKMENEFLVNMKDSVKSVFSVAGFSFAGVGQNQAALFVELKDWSERKGPGQSAKEIQGRAMGTFMQMKEAMAFAMIPPAVQELGNTSGFDFRLIDTGGLGHEAMTKAQFQLLGLAAQNPALQGVRPNSMSDKADLWLDIDYQKAQTLGVSVADINRELANIFGSSYINDFIDKGRVKKVYMQGDAPFRMSPEDLSKWYLRNSKGEMVPFAGIINSRWVVGAPKLSRFNGAPSLAIAGEAAPGHSSGEAMQAMEDLVKQLPTGIGFQWAAISYEERLSGSSSLMLYGLALLMVFLCLAALYESWAIPVAVFMDMPLGALGVLAACALRGLPNDTYFQIGLITIIGLSAKNAILVVEFAKERYDHGEKLHAATLESVKQRLRPIMMTSIAFGLGVLPLALSTGPGAGSQNAIGTGIVGGALTTTILGLFFVPFYFVTVLELFGVKPKKTPGEGYAAPPEPGKQAEQNHRRDNKDGKDDDADQDSAPIAASVSSTPKTEAKEKEPANA